MNRSRLLRSMSFNSMFAPAGGIFGLNKLTSRLGLLTGILSLRFKVVEAAYQNPVATRDDTHARIGNLSHSRALRVLIAHVPCPPFVASR